MQWIVEWIRYLLSLPPWDDDRPASSHDPPSP